MLAEDRIGAPLEHVESIVELVCFVSTQALSFEVSMLLLRWRSTTDLETRLSTRQMFGFMRSLELPNEEPVVNENGETPASPRLYPSMPGRVNLVCCGVMEAKCGRGASKRAGSGFWVDPILITKLDPNKLNQALRGMTCGLGKRGLDYQAEQAIFQACLASRAAWMSDRAGTN